MKRKISSLYPIGEYCNLTAKRLSVNILCSIFLISLCFCNVENPQSKNNRRNFSVFTYFANLPVNLNIVTTQVGSMYLTHTNPRAILLDNGKVLVVGNGAELFDPTALNYSVIPNRTLTRTSHTVTKLQDGRILVLGGNTSAVELFNSTTLTFANTGSMFQSVRYGHTSNLLPNGKVLVAGGYQTSSSSPLLSAELYDPTTGVFTSTGNMNYARRTHNATLLADGTVLITGGFDSLGNRITIAEIYNPSTGLFTVLSNSSCQNTNRNTAVLLSNKNVFVADNGSPKILQIFNTSTNICSILQISLRGISSFAITSLKDGRVLLVGGFANGYAIQELNVYDPNTNTLNFLGNMQVAKYYPLATTLLDGRVLMNGSYSTDDSKISEIYTPSGTPQ